METKSVVSAGPLQRFVRRYRNANTAIAQIRNCEWVPKYNPISREHLTAHRGDLELWIGNGPIFCEIKGPQRYFGLFWRHYVWWAAARWMKTKADREYVDAAGVPTL